MKARFVIVVATALILVAAAAATARIAGGPPTSFASHLTENGRTLWNLDALMNDAFPLRNPCLDLRHYTFYSVRAGRDCAGTSRPATTHYSYVFTYLGAIHSQFQLVRLSRTPRTGVKSAALSIGGRYISCPLGQYHHGPGWLVFGGGSPPNAEIWCY